MLRCLLLGCWLISPLAALTAEQVALLVNRSEPAAADVAAHYRALRQVPEANTLTVDLPFGETLPRESYEQVLLPAVREWLAAPERQGRIRCLLAIYGMPLRVGNRAAAPADALQPLQTERDRTKEARQTAEERLKVLRAQAARSEAEAVEMADLERRLPELRRAANTAETAWARAAGNETTSSLEGELALLAWPPYDAYRWVYNALHFGFSDAQRQQAPPVYLTARLDAPDPEQAKRLVTDAVRAEREGLKGTFYLDARGIALKADQPDWYGYGGYDQSLRDLAEVLKTQTTLPVVLDDKPELFAAGGCPAAALYCGWYKLANYVDAFDWAPGAVAYHIASAEATTLRNPSSQVWCKKLLEDGVAATLGPVAEPYTVGFPKPYEFFVTLLSGRYTLVETYYRTLMLNSWMTTLIGDPLYNPFGARPVLSEELLRLSPPGAPALWAQP